MKQLTIIGNVGQDAVVKISNNEEVVRFTVAVNDRRKNQLGEQIEDTTWFTVFTRHRNLAQFLTKGTQVFVQGNAKFGIFQDDYGAARIDLTIAASQIQLLGSKKEETTPARPVQQQQLAAAPAPQQTRAQSAPTPVARPAQAGRLQTTPSMDLTATPDDDLPF